MLCSFLLRKVGFFILICSVLIISSLLSLPGLTLQAAVISPGFSKAKAPLVPSGTARDILRKSAAVFSMGITDAGTASVVTPEIQELARGLKNDPVLIYKFIRNNIDYTPIYGSVKGANMTLLDRRGNDFDQTSLFIALMRAAGYTANYVYGQISLTADEITNWLGLPPDCSVVANVLGDAGIPAEVYCNSPEELAFVQLDHVWAKANIGGTDYVFDVSFKPYTYTTGINLSSAMGYDQTTFLNHGLQGATVDPNYVQNINAANIRSDLGTFSMNLVNYIKTNMFDADLAGLIGGRIITATDTMPQEASLPYQLSIQAEWTEIPASYHTTLRIQHLGIDETLSSHDIYGKRLTIFYNASNQPELRLDGALMATGLSAIPGQNYNITLSIDHPYAAYSGTYQDRTFTTQLKAGNSYNIVNGWAGTGRNVIEKHRKILKENRDSGASDNSEPVLGESLSMIAFSWLSETYYADQITDKLANTITIHHHTVGFTGQAESPYIDMPLVDVSIISTENDLAKEDTVFAVQAGISSAFEWGVIEQLQPHGAVSTVKLINISNNKADKIFNTDLSNWATVKPQLVNYSSGKISYVEAYINAGYRLTLPQDGNLNDVNWYGIGFISWYEDAYGSSIGHTIGGGLKGGYGNKTWSLSQYFNDVYGGLLSAVTPSTNPTSTEPVDLVTGNYLYNNDDLSIGSGKFPFTLTFSRSYNSSGRLEEGPLGRGWTHNFDISATRMSDGFQGLGADSPIDAAPAIAELYATINLLSAAKSNANTVIATLAHKWFMDRLIDKVVTVKIAGDSYQFVELPDGSFNPTPASADILTAETDGSFLLNRKYGITLDFGTDGKVISWNDPQKTVQFQYASGKLTQVSNQFGRYLRLNYSGDHITSVSDSSGRSVQYGFDASGNLATFINAGSKPTTFSYDSKHLLSQVFYPANPANSFVTNIYDDLDRVKEQRNARNLTYNFYYSYYSTEEDDPLIHKRVRYFDDQGHLTADEDALGHKTTYIYDGRGRRTSITYPRGNSIQYVFDTKHNITQATRIPVAGSGEPNIVEAFTYEPVFNFIEAYTDLLGNLAKYYYDGNSNLIKTEQPLVNGQKPTTTFTYNSRGQVETVTDPKGVVTRYEYDPASADLLRSIVDYGSNPDDLNITTSMSYNSAGNVQQMTDPRGNSATFQYNNLRNVTQITSPSPFSYITKYSYDDNSNVKQVDRETRDVSHPWQSIQYTYTLTGEIETMTDGMGHVTTNVYDQADRLWKVTDALAHTTERLYDENNRLWKQIDGRGKTEVEYSYTENGKLAWLKDGKTNQTSYTYDGLDRPRRTIYPDSTYEELTYDLSGNTVSKRTRAGQTITYSYDPLNRLITKALPAPLPKTINHTYDLVGRLIDAIDPAGTIHHAYDDAGRLLSVTYPDSKAVSYEYDAMGNRTKLTYPDSTFVTHQYDQLNRVTDIYNQGTTLLAHYSYDPLSRRTGLNYANGTTTNYSSYDWANNLKQLQHQFSGSSLNYSYTYDNVGNRKGASIDSNNYKYNPTASLINYTSNNLNQYTAVGGLTYTYDGNGNLTSDGTNTYTYDAENQLLTANTSSYSYDPLGRRISKTVSGTTTKYLHDTIHEICEYNASNQLLRKYVYGPGIDQPVCMISGGNVYYYHLDGLGSVFSLTNSSGTPIEGYVYSAYGDPLIIDPATGTIRSSSLADNQYLYTGRRYDSESGLYYYRTRYMTPEIGRLLQTDTIGYRSGDYNLYRYVENNPFRFSDPLGLEKTVSNNDNAFLNYLNSGGLISYGIETKMSSGISAYGITGSGFLGLKSAFFEAILPFDTSVTREARTQYYDLGHDKGQYFLSVQTDSGGISPILKLLYSGDIGGINTLIIKRNNFLVPGPNILNSLGVKNVIYKPTFNTEDPHILLSLFPTYDLTTKGNDKTIWLQWRVPF